MRVYDDGLLFRQHPFVVAEYLPGTLGDVLRTSPPMMAKLGYALQMLSGLDYLAGLGVVHRDLKPANIFIKGGSCVIGDFGLAKQVGSEAKLDLEMLRESVGPRMPRAYRTPDLVNYLRGGPQPTPKSDIFQIGLVFAEMFSGRNPEQKMKERYEEDIVLEDFGIDGGLGDPIKSLIAPMLEFDPNRRPSADQLIPQWQPLYIEAAKRSHALEGRVL